MIRLVEHSKALQLQTHISVATSTSVPRQIICAPIGCNPSRGKIVASIGPFELTEAEVIGLEFLRQEDERQLRKTELHATWSGRVLTVKVKKLLFGIPRDIADVESRSSQIAQ